MNERETTRYYAGYLAACERWEAWARSVESRDGQRAAVAVAAQATAVRRMLLEDIKRAQRAAGVA